jgi:hypothetical protein
LRPNRIALANWREPQNLSWSYRHVRELIPTAGVRRGAQASALGEATPRRDGLAAERLLDDDSTDGLIVLHDGEVVVEQYRRGMEPDDVRSLGEPGGPRRRARRLISPWCRQRRRHLAPLAYGSLRKNAAASSPTTDHAHWIEGQFSTGAVLNCALTSTQTR